MKIGIDISQIVFRGTGTETYTRNLVKGLLHSGNKIDYSLFGSSFRQTQQIKNFAAEFSCQSKIVYLPPAVLDLMWNRFHIFPVDNFIGPVDIFHSSDWTQPPTKAKKLTTIHDLVVYKYPESSHPKIVETHKRRLEWVKKECDAIIAVSQATKRDITEILGIPPDRIRVIYEAAGSKYHEFNKLTSPEKRSRFALVKSKYSLPEHYFLSVGTREPRKNLERLVRAFISLKENESGLVIAGKYGWGTSDIGLGKNIKTLGYIPEDDLIALYWGARAFVYPSLYEGFGLPVVEAMTVGCPVITSHVSSLPEVGGKAGVYVDPLSIGDIAARMTDTLKMNKKEYDDLVKESLEQGKKFSWEKTAKETMAIYEALN